MSGFSSIIVKVNFPPKLGSCFITPKNGSTSTLFTIECSNWRDPDGSLISYAYYAKLLDDQLDLGLGFSFNGILTTKLFAGAVYDNNQMRIYIQVYDDEEAFAVYEIPHAVSVEPDLTDLNVTIEKLVLDDPFFATNIILHEGSYLRVIQEIHVISSLLNIHSLSDKLGFIRTGKNYVFPQTYGPLSNYSGVQAVNDPFLYLGLKAIASYFFPNYSNAKPQSLRKKSKIFNR